MVERGGRVKAARRQATARPSTLQGTSCEFVLPGSTLFTDEWPAYKPLRERYDHRRISHSESIYVSGDVHTQTIEGFFGNLKTRHARHLPLGLAASGFRAT